MGAGQVEVAIQKWADSVVANGALVTEVLEPNDLHIRKVKVDVELFEIVVGSSVDVEPGRSRELVFLER